MVASKAFTNWGIWYRRAFTLSILHSHLIVDRFSTVNFTCSCTISHHCTEELKSCIFSGEGQRSSMTVQIKTLLYHQQPDLGCGSHRAHTQGLLVCVQHSPLYTLVLPLHVTPIVLWLPTTVRVLCLVAVCSDSLWKCHTVIFQLYHGHQQNPQNAPQWKHQRLFLQFTICMTMDNCSVWLCQVYSPWSLQST